jgi:MoxR-like ATPase
VDAVRRAILEVVRGKNEVVDLALAAVLAGGHLLVQDVPGVGKTTLAGALAAVLGGTFARIQFTPDLLPSDLTGVNVLDRATGALTFRPGPLFANVVLADELNRTSPRTQSALFEAMEEGQVTVDGVTRKLPRPFAVIATQNPFDHHGTYPIPESQLDRFLVRISLGYPDRDSERGILRRAGPRPTCARVLEPAGWSDLIGQSERVSVPAAVEDYLLDLVRATRSDHRLLRGVSTRGAQALYRVVRAWALVRGRSFAIPEDVRELAAPVLGHRVLARSGGVGGDGGTAAIGAILDEIRAPS